MWLLARHGSARDCELPSVRGRAGRWACPRPVWCLEGGWEEVSATRVCANGVLGGGRGRGSHRRVRRAACGCAVRAPTD
eukprot:6045364-Prymnesium_polylepis.1